MIRLLGFTDACLLLIFLIELFLFSIGFGLLYNRRYDTIATWILIAINISVLVVAYFKKELLLNLLSYKILSSIFLFYFRLDTLRSKITLLSKSRS